MGDQAWTADAIREFVPPPGRRYLLDVCRALRAHALGLATIEDVDRDD